MRRGISLFAGLAAIVGSLGRGLLYGGSASELPYEPPSTAPKGRLGSFTPPKRVRPSGSERRRLARKHRSAWWGGGRVKSLPQGYWSQTIPTEHLHGHARARVAIEAGSPYEATCRRRGRSAWWPHHWRFTKELAMAS